MFAIKLSMAKTFLISYPPFENPTTRIAIAFNKPHKIEIAQKCMADKKNVMLRKWDKILYEESNIYQNRKLKLHCMQGKTEGT